jgi:hypothetical protein
MEILPAILAKKTLHPSLPRKRRVRVAKRRQFRRHEKS